ncbi:MAG: beta-ketoacyl-[acyl-carrier-protein] synthase family protein [Acetobacteraceae bacterium]|jgi:nodulation protein E
MNRVVITGIGVVSPVGSTLEDFWSALVEGRSAIGPFSIARSERLSTRIAAQVRQFDAAALFAPKQLAPMDRFSQFAVVAARAAVRDADLTISERLALETATVIGNASAGQTTLDDAYFKLYAENSSRLHPLTIPRLMTSAAASQISMDLGLKGPTFCVGTACAAGTHAIGLAFHMLRSGQAPVALAGGAEACLTAGTIKAWEALRVLSQDTCRPFSRTRSGLVLGEGAAVLLLEERAHALARGARVYAEILGFGMSADAGDITASDPDGAARAMRAALKDARRNADDVGYINAHGTGTMHNDRSETTALRDVFGPDIRRIAVSSSKAVLGHGLGAAGALEMAVTTLAIHHQTIPPTANFEAADPDCDLDVVPNVARHAKVNVAMSNSFAFGGLNAVLLAARA